MPKRKMTNLTTESYSSNGVDVYLAALPEEMGNKPLFSEERQTEVDRTAHPLVKRQKYYVWRLLEYALRNRFGTSADALVFRKGDNGKWSTDGCFFSLSHSDRVLAVAVSQKAVGVDIEKCAMPRAENFPHKMLTSKEYEDFCSVPTEDRAAFLIAKWTAKESVFKMRDEAVFRPHEISAESAAYTDWIDIGGERYLFSVSSESVDGVRIHRDIDLSET